MSLLERPLFAVNPRFLTPEQAALLALFDRLDEIEKLYRVELSIQEQVERDLMARIKALEARIAELEARA